EIRSNWKLPHGRKLLKSGSSGMIQNMAGLVVRRGRRRAKSDGEDPPADDAEEGNNDAEELRDNDTEAKKSGDKASASEESGEQVEDSDPPTTPEA
ncbi:hypothetical protein HAX54_013360, partial [Datura stramonium]|nr:hypothetical protein [Datura stramonium]